MGDESVLLVRSVYETWNEQGPAAIRPMVAEDVELHDAPELPDAQVWHGRDAVVARLEAVAATMGGGSVDIRDVRTTDDGVLVAMCWHLDRDTEEVDLGQVFHLVRVSDGLVAQIRVFLTESDALLA